MNSVVSTSYSQGMVLLSYVISMIGSLVALTAARRITLPSGGISWANLVTAGLALGGVGVWAMHFIGMLAMSMDLGVGYSLPETLLSLAAAVVATSIALAFVSRNPSHFGRLASAGTLLGMGVGFMHYLGMYGMRFGGYIEWSYDVVGISMVIAIVAATAALWLAFNTRTLVARVTAAAVMGGAVCAMHYTGMAAAQFVCTTANRYATPTGFGVISSLDLPVLVTLLAMGMAIVLSIDQAMQRVLTPHR
ncbi:MAG: histidine kinase [Ramlibacter sp.]|nr:histidine kinase [Ramlibacter sp.]